MVTAGRGMSILLGSALVFGGALVGCIGGFGIATMAEKDTAGRATTIVDDGVLLVPAEVVPGTYRATVPADSRSCYWARLNGTSGVPEDIVANGNANTGQRVTVTVGPTDKAFESTGCGVWTRVG